jgi:hypothetical protein
MTNATLALLQNPLLQNTGTGRIRLWLLGGAVPTRSRKDGETYVDRTIVCGIRSVPAEGGSATGL